MLCDFLTSDQMARSHEFLVSYRLSGRHDILLCGLQEYVEGEIFDPWAEWNQQSVQSLFSRLQGITRAKRPLRSADRWISLLKNSAKALIGSLKALMIEAGHIPDLAGLGNLIITPDGTIKLVDINNISFIPLGTSVPIDDRGYPVCDKSIEALYLLEKGLLDRRLDPQDALYGPFFNPERKRKVKRAERDFFRSMSNGSMPEGSKGVR